MGRRCMVIRIDGHGNAVLVKDDLTPSEAERLANDLSAGAHKQSYEIMCYQHSSERERLLKLMSVHV